jgi:hypothetical protein
MDLDIRERLLAYNVKVSPTILELERFVLELWQG